MGEQIIEERERGRQCVGETRTATHRRTDGGRSALSARRAGLVGRDPPAPPPSAGAPMRPSTALGPPQAGLIGAAGSRTRGRLPPGYPPPRAARGSPPASGCSPCGPVRRITGTPLILSHMCFPRGAGCLTIPSGRAPRFRSTPWCWRLRATTTLLRSASASFWFVAYCMLSHFEILLLYAHYLSQDLTPILGTAPGQ